MLKILGRDILRRAFGKDLKYENRANGVINTHTPVYFTAN